MAEQEIKIEIDNSDAGGVYSNFAVISHNENEFILDFVFIHPPKGKVNSRVIMSPAHAKRFLQAMKENIELYEKNLGNIKESKEPPKFNVDFSRN